MITRQPIFELVSFDRNNLIVEAETIDQLLLAAATLREDGEAVDEMVVLKGGAYDAGTTALIQEGWLE